MATISLVGRISANFQSKQLENGNWMIYASMAENHKTKDGVEYPEWYQVSYFSKSNALAQYLEKGARVYVAGRITFNEFKDTKTGHTYYHKNINADVFDLLDWKKQEDAPSMPELPENPLPAASATPENNG